MEAHERHGRGAQRVRLEGSGPPDHGGPDLPSIARPELAAFLRLAQGRRGHFRLESGHHSTLWLDLDSLFADPQAIAPFVDALAAQLQDHAIDIVCGPLLGGAFLAQLLAQSLAAEFCFTERSAVKADGLFGTRYELPPAHRTRLRGRRVALVDDVMSAGSALRGTHAVLQAVSAIPVVAGAILVLGDLGAGYFAQQHLPLAVVLREDYELWTPAVCPLCMAGEPLENAGTPAA
jgi:orotate phosphoribosyltransferase